MHGTKIIHRVNHVECSASFSYTLRVTKFEYSALHVNTTQTHQNVHTNVRCSQIGIPVPLPTPPLILLKFNSRDLCCVILLH